MKTYCGVRTIDGLKVTVDGDPLDERYDVKQFTSWGFEWTYEGAEPQQLALAILADHLGDGIFRGGHYGQAIAPPHAMHVFEFVLGLGEVEVRCGDGFGGGRLGGGQHRLRGPRVRRLGRGQHP